MHIIYLDNFRGFQKDYTFLTPVTFLVGENSTGKTSFLMALDLLCSRDFWSFPSFSKNPTLGSFTDIVSANSSNRNYFTIGWCSSVLGHEDKTSVFALLTFKNDAGKPSLFRYSFLMRNSVVKIQYSAKGLGYKIEKINKRKMNLHDVADTFAETTKSHHIRIRNLTKVETGDIEFPLRSPYYGPTIFLKELQSSKKQKQIVLSPVMFHSGGVTSVAPIRTQPKSIYDAVEPDSDSLGTHTPYILRHELGNHNTNSELADSLNRFGKDSGLFENIEVHNFASEKDSPSGSGDPFEIGVVLDRNSINLSYVGYGVSQVLPIAVDIFRSKSGHKIIIQQPEVHLHPKAQAAFGDLVFHAAKSDKKWLFIETHSDFVIDRFRLAMSNARKKENNPDSTIVFFERNHGRNKTIAIQIEQDGRYEKNQPQSFRDFFLNESLDLLKI